MTPPRPCVVPSGSLAGRGHAFVQAPQAFAQGALRAAEVEAHVRSRCRAEEPPFAQADSVILKMGDGSCNPRSDTLIHARYVASIGASIRAPGMVSAIA